MYRSRGSSTSACASLDRYIILLRQRSSYLRRPVGFRGSFWRYNCQSCFYSTTPTNPCSLRIPTKSYSWALGLRLDGSSTKYRFVSGRTDAMATARRIQLSTSDSGIFSSGVREDSAQVASELLQEDLEKHHVYFNNMGFHGKYHVSPCTKLYKMAM